MLKIATLVTLLVLLLATFVDLLVNQPEATWGWEEWVNLPLLVLSLLIPYVWSSLRAALNARRKKVVSRKRAVSRISSWFTGRG